VIPTNRQASCPMFRTCNLSFTQELKSGRFKKKTGFGRRSIL